MIDVYLVPSTCLSMRGELAVGLQREEAARLYSVGSLCSVCYTVVAMRGAVSVKRVMHPKELT